LNLLLHLGKAFRIAAQLLVDRLKAERLQIAGIHGKGLLNDLMR
jgi:hypothetical protein